MMSEGKWAALKKAMQFQKENFEIMKNGMFIGGMPEENNVYGFIGWSEEGEGIIALRNPTENNAPLTLTFNSLMGAPETLEGVRRHNVYCKSLPEDETRYNYNDKLKLTLHPFEIIILKFEK